jgi:hypothetical protein
LSLSDTSKRCGSGGFAKINCVDKKMAELDLRAENAGEKRQVTARVWKRVIEQFASSARD